jgi:glycosyltransferase involved in cell wall biosynthesis
LDTEGRRDPLLREEHKLITSEPNPDITAWKAGSAPVAVVMISLNESHNMDAVLQNLAGWAQEVFLVDSYSADETVDIALRHGVHVVQRRFKGFGDQWNFALSTLPIKAPWTMKLDPDERLSDALKGELEERMINPQHKPENAVSIVAYRLPIRLFFMGKRLPHVLNLIRIWRTGAARFSDVLANEHALFDGNENQISEEIHHLDSPDLTHWFNKQNQYSTAEALSQYNQFPLTDAPKLFGTRMQRRMWLKRNIWRFPGRYAFLFVYHLLVVGAWRSGRVGWMWSHLRTEVFRMQEYKLFEMNLRGQRSPSQHITTRSTTSDPRVTQYE